MSWAVGNRCDLSCHTANFLLIGSGQYQIRAFYNMLEATHPTDTMAGKEKLFLISLFGHTPEVRYENTGELSLKTFMPKDFRKAEVAHKGEFTKWAIKASGDIIMVLTAFIFTPLPCKLIANI